jgi:hypothetical protein
MRLLLGAVNWEDWRGSSDVLFYYTVPTFSWKWAAWWKPRILTAVSDAAYCHCFMCVASHLMLMEALRKLRVGFLTLPTFRRGLSTQKTAVGTSASQISYYLLPYKWSTWLEETPHCCLVTDVEIYVLIVGAGEIADTDCHPRSRSNNHSDLQLCI